MTYQNVIAPDTALYENCPVMSKVEAAVIQQGTSSTVQWEFRDRDGCPIDLSGCFHIPFQPEPPDFDAEQEDSSSEDISKKPPQKRSKPTGLLAAILNLQNNDCEHSFPQYEPPPENPTPHHGNSDHEHHPKKNILY